MLDENDVIHAVVGYLGRQGFTVTQSLHSTERGVDIIATHDSSKTTFWIEAKGGTSSVSSSKRYGKPYTQSQVFDRVAKGVFTALTLRASLPGPTELVGLAIPHERWFLSYTRPIASALHNLGITILTVSADGEVCDLAASDNRKTITPTEGQT